GEGLGLVLALERAVVTFVETPRAGDGNPGPVGGEQGDVGGLDRAGQQRGVQHIGQQTRLGKQLTAALGLGLALLGQADIHPSRKQIQLVPLALAVTKKDEGAWRSHALILMTAHGLPWVVETVGSGAARSPSRPHPRARSRGAWRPPRSPPPAR